MDELILQVLSGSATPSQEERVRNWRAESPENDAYFGIIDQIWRATGRTVTTPAGRPLDLDRILTAAEERRLREKGGVVSLHDRRTRRRGFGWSLAAAAAVVAVALGVRAGLPVRPPAPTAIYAAEAGTARSVGLDDGSFVLLAPGSRLQVWDDGDGRRMSLTGRAFFAVAHDERRPFVVAAGSSEARVLGTRFEVSDQGGDVRTVVLEGRVAVSNGGGTVEVPGGSIARTRGDAPPVVETPADIYALLEWPDGVLLFQGTPLSQVASEVGRHFGRSVEVEGERLSALRISGSFDGVPFEEVVLALCDAAGARCSFTDEGARIGPRT